MKRWNLKKGEIAIYVVAIMLVAAGYFNYMNFNLEDTKVSANVDNEEKQNTSNIGDAVLVSNNEVNEISEEKNEENLNENSVVDNNKISKNEKEQKKEDENGKNEAEKDKTKEDETKKDENENEDSKKDNEDSKKDNEDYYLNSKLDRDKMYAEMITNYENILNNSNASEVQKNIATEEIKKINNIKNAIMISENLILTKGFENCLIFINEDSVNIVVHKEQKLNTEDISKIQNIITREIGTEIENIHITER